MSPAPATRRQNHGRGHSYYLDGEKAVGVTTVLNALPKPALVPWAAGAVGEFVAEAIDHVDGHYLADRLVTELGAAARDLNKAWPDKFSRTKAAEVMKALPYRERDAAANKGTRVHDLAERLAAGDEVEVPDELVGHVDSYLRFRDEWEPYDEVTEFVVINRGVRPAYMGTADLECRFRAAPELGRCLVDIKTNRSGPFGEVALQLAAYRYAESRLTPDGDEEEMPEFDNCLVLWVRADGYDLVPFTAGPREFRDFQYVAQVYEFTQRDRSLRGDALLPPVRA